MVKTNYIDKIIDWIMLLIVYPLFITSIISHEVLRSILIAKFGIFTKDMI